MNSRVLYWQKLWSEFAVWGKVRIECSRSCLPCWWLCCYIDPVKCLWNVSPPPSSLSPPSHHPPNSSSGLCVFLLFIPTYFQLFFLSFIPSHPASSSPPSPLLSRCRIYDGRDGKEEYHGGACSQVSHPCTSNLCSLTLCLPLPQTQEWVNTHTVFSPEMLQSKKDKVVENKSSYWDGDRNKQQRC